MAKLRDLIKPEEIAVCTSAFYPNEERCSKAHELCVVKGDVVIFNGIAYCVSKTGTYKTAEIEVDVIAPEGS